MGGMTGDAMLNWALIALSSFNTIIPIWLGLTVLLNAERRAWGVWLAGTSLFISGVFFIFHTLLLEGSLFSLRLVLGPLWYARWLPVIALPLAWYCAMLWFAGFWEGGNGKLRRFHRPALGLVLLLALAVTVLLLLSVGRFTAVNRLDVVDPGIPVMEGFTAQVVLYPLYILCCFLFSLHVLRNIEPSGRAMGDLARMRARPWLAGTTIFLIGVSLLVTWALYWVLRERGMPVLTISDLLTLHWFDFGISLLIACAVFSLGQAVVSYEIFTGKILPRQGFRRHWINAIVLAAGYSGLLSLALVLELPPIHGLLIATVLIAFFYALLNWRSFAERDRYLEHLRPFIGSQQVYELLMADGGRVRSEPNVAVPFRALCADVLGTVVAYLVPLGPMATLAGPPLFYPVPRPEVAADRSRLGDLLDSSRTLGISVDPAEYGGAVWAIPLWSERGLIGALLLGEKLDGGLYTQEEMEIARASGERLIDIQAGVEMARRLMELQRRRLAESQVMDAQTRRVLHDDVLPQLHAVMLTLSGGQASTHESIGMMSDLHKKVSDLLRALPSPAAQAVERLGIVAALEHMVCVELASAFTEVRWSCDDSFAAQLPRISTLAADVLYYAARESMRNAARYGRGGNARRALHLTVHLGVSDALELTIEDDGVGTDGAVKTDGGSGQGLGLHSTMMAVVGGSLAIESVRDSYTRVRLRVPMEKFSIDD